MKIKLLLVLSMLCAGSALDSSEKLTPQGADRLMKAFCRKKSSEEPKRGALPFVNNHGKTEKSNKSRWTGKERSSKERLVFTKADRMLQAHKGKLKNKI